MLLCVFLSPAVYGLLKSTRVYGTVVRLSVHSHSQQKAQAATFEGVEACRWHVQLLCLLHRSALNPAGVYSTVITYTRWTAPSSTK